MHHTLQFKVLCRLHQDDVYRFARYLLGNATEAEDATQEVLLKLWRSIGDVNPLKARAWLMRTTRHQCLDELRKRGRHPHEALDAAEGGADALECPSPSPRDLAQRRQQRALLEEALAELPEVQRSIFVLREVNGLRLREIAETLGLPLGTVKVYFSRARDALTARLAQPEPSTAFHHAHGSQEVNA